MHRILHRHGPGIYRVTVLPRSSGSESLGDAFYLVVEAPTRRLAAEAAEHAAERAQGGIHRAVSVRVAPRQTAPDLVL
jgi:hypothetical protein